MYDQKSMPRRAFSGRICLTKLQLSKQFPATQIKAGAWFNHLFPWMLTENGSLEETEPPRREDYGSKSTAKNYSPRYAAPAPV